MKAQIVFVFWAMSLSLNAQSDYQWEKYLNEVMSAEDMESAEWEDSYEMLCELAQHPLDLNHATGRSGTVTFPLSPTGGGDNGVYLSLWSYEVFGRTADDPFARL